MKKSVIVVGGGVAGLSVASLLAKHTKFDVTLLEAADRIGGRVHTIKAGAAGNLEIGAQWVHGSNRVFELVNKFGNKFLENDTFWDQMETNTDFGTCFGVANFPPEKLKKFLELFSILNEGPTEQDLKDVSVGDWFLKRVKAEEFAGDTAITGFVDWLERLQVSIDGADNWFDSSIRGQLEYEVAPGCPVISWTTGYDTLFNVLLNESTTDSTIPSWIKLNSQVSQIDYTSKPIVTRTESGSVYESDIVIVTVSLGVLKAKHRELFKPNLPALKIHTIENLGYGTVNKVHIQFEEPWWDSDWLGINTLWTDGATTDFPLWAQSIMGFYTSKSCSNTLTGWITGPNARLIETLDTDEVSSVVLKLLKKFVGKKNIPDGIVSVTKWYTNPFTQGSYSFRSLKSEEENVWAKDLAQPIDVPYDGLLCFAGEATHDSFFSTVHGAYETGEREASRLIALYGNNPTK